MELGEQQRKFSLMLFTFGVWLYREGYEVTLGDAFATTGHKDNSFHYKRLAIDLNLFKDDVYLTETSDYEHIGLEWERLGGCWGGRFDDGNHFSYMECNNED